MAVQVINRHNHSKKGIYIGRGTPLGNQWSHLKYPGVKHVVKSRKEAIEAFQAELRRQWKVSGPMKAALLGLVSQAKKGDLTLICSCKPLSCHGDVIKEAIDTLIEKGY